MTPVVLVELSAEEAASPHAEALLSACTAGLRRGECVLEGTTEPKSRPTAVAIVTWTDSMHLEVLVEVGSEREGKPRWMSRQLHFHPVDVETERFRSVGFAVASLAAASSLPETEPGPPRPAPTPPPSPSPPPVKKPSLPLTRAHTPEATHRGPVGISARTETGPGLDSGPFRFGASLAVAYDLFRPNVSFFARGGYAIRPDAVDSIDLSFATLSTGIGTFFSMPFDTEARFGVAVVAENVRAAETDPSSRESQSRNRWLGGGGGAVGVRWPRTGPVGAIVGAEILRLSGGTAIRSHGSVRAQSPATEPSLFAGIELSLPPAGKRY